MTDKRREFIKGFAHMLECDAQKVVPEAVLADIGTWDSLNVMGTVVLIDDIYGKVVHGRPIAQCVTVGDILKIAEGS